jgi:hypothetical protein
MTQLTDEQVRQFQHDGFLLIEDFYDSKTIIEPIQRGAYDIIGLVAMQHGVELQRRPFDPENFDDGFMQLIAADRRLGSIVYDAVKQLAPFVRLTASPDNEAIFKQLRSTDTVGIAGGGSGIRIDIPGEEKYRAAWHQEYPAQFRSLDGLVFWSGLRRVTPELGPVDICVGSQREGLINVFNENEGDFGRSGAYALRLAGEEKIISRYDRVQPLAKPGDVLIMDFLTVHASGFNRSTHPRWSMQLRYFNFAEPTGRQIDWSGSFAAGVAIQDVHPGLLVSK